MAAEQPLKSDVSELIKFQRDFTAKEVAIATARAINYALALTRTQMKRDVTAEYNLRSSDVGNKNIVVARATYARNEGKVLAYAGAESIAHFANVTEFKDVLGAKRGGGFIKTTKGKGGYYKSSRNDKNNTSKSGVYFTVVKGQKQHMPGAFLVFFGTSPVVMARGKYGFSGRTHDFRFAGKGDKSPVSKINSKSVYWGIMNNHTISRWQPWTLQWYMKEATRLYMNLAFGVKF